MIYPQRKQKAKKYPVEMEKTPTGKRPWTSLKPPSTKGGQNWHALRRPKKEFWR